jgi:Heavy metal associated domain 2
MPPQAEITHQTSRRLRLRIPERKRDRDFFQTAAEEIARCPGVNTATGNPMTGSLLIDHNASIPDIIGYAEKNGLFKTAKERARPANPVNPGLTRRLSRGVRQVNQRLSAATNGEIDLSAGVFLTLVGLAAYQTFVQRRFLPAGASLLWYAATVLSRSRTDKSESAGDGE